MAKPYVPDSKRTNPPALLPAFELVPPTVNFVPEKFKHINEMTEADFADGGLPVGIFF